MFPIPLWHILLPECGEELMYYLWWQCPQEIFDPDRIMLEKWWIANHFLSVY
jgi:hypothetical protein